MKMKKRFTFLWVLTLWTITTLFSQTSLKIINTDWWGGGDIGQGTIEEAMIVIQPQGAYMEIEMIITFLPVLLFTHPAFICSSSDSIRFDLGISYAERV
jgi:hypothetical protein